MSGILQSLLGSFGGVVRDAYFNLVTLLLNTTTTNGAQNNTFLDSSTNNFTITRNGNTTQGTFTPFSQTGWSNYLGGAGNYFQTPANSASTIVGTLSSTTNLTIECWIYPTAYNSSANFPGLIGDMQATVENNNWSWGITNTGTLMLYWNSGSQIRAYTTNTVSLNTWTHIALNVASGAITMYINGVSQTLTGTTTLSTPSSSNNYLVIGQWNNGSGGTGGVSNGLFTGYISNLRVVKASTYTSSFTPSTTPLTAIANTSLLYCQSNRFVDNSSNALAITTGGTPSVQAFSPFAPTAAYSTSVVGGSGYFDGNGDYLSVPDNAAFAFGANPFTLEFWFYPTLSATNQYIFDQNKNVSGDSSFQFWINTSNVLACSVFSGTTEYAINSSALSLNQWYHVALVRSGVNLSAYINGTRIGTLGTLSTNTINDSTAEVRIGNLGNSPTNSFPYQGYVSNARIVKGTAVYDPTLTTLTVPTAPLTAITNTQLLVSATNAGIYDSASKNVLETVGNAQVSTTQAKWGTTSMYFDGTGDYLQIPDSNLFISGTENFTVEMWVYLSAAGTMYIAGQCDSSGTVGSQSIAILKTSTEKLQCYAVSGTTQYICTSTANISQNTWTYIAFVRNGSTLTQYINGSADGTATISTASVNNSSNKFGVGSLGEYTVNTTNGYIDDFRITKGYARTISASPTVAFPIQ